MKPGPGHAPHIACVIHSLGNGGAERMLTTMANYWAAAGNRVDILVLGGRQDPVYPLDAGATVHFLDVAGRSAGLLHSIRSNLGRVASIRNALKSIAPDMVISFMDTTNVTTITAAAGLGLRVVATEHTDPVRWPIGRLWEILRLAAYPFADAVTVQTREAYEYYPRLIRKKAHVLPNPVFVAPPGEGEVGAPGGPFLMGLGRLSKEKGFSRLIKAFAVVADRHPDWRLVILGEGPQRRELETLRSDLGLGGRILLPGFSDRPHDWLRASSLFVLSSEFEGFGNVLVEALMCGVPVIARNCSGGARDIVRDGVNGLLVSGRDSELAQALDALMADTERRTMMAGNAVDSVLRYSLSNVMKEWERVLMSRADAG